MGEIRAFYKIFGCSFVGNGRNLVGFMFRIQVVRIFRLTRIIEIVFPNCRRFFNPTHQKKHDAQPANADDQPNMLPGKKARQTQIKVRHGGSDGRQQQTTQTRCEPAIFFKPRRYHATPRQHVRLHGHTDGDKGAKEDKKVETWRSGKDFQRAHADKRAAEQGDKSAQEGFCRITVVPTPDVRQSDARQ